MRRPLPSVLALLLTAFAAAPAAAQAPATGGTEGSATSGATPAGVQAPATGGTDAAAAPIPGVAPGGNQYGRPFRIPPVIRLFAASPRSTFANGPATRLRYRVDSVNARTVHLIVTVHRQGRRVARVDLGRVRTGRIHTYRWRRAGLATGAYALGLNVVDGGGRGLARAARTTIRIRPRPRPRPAPAPASSTDGVFPIRGSYSWSEGFGVDRGDHRHNGQDLPADSGTPIVSPRRGTVVATGFGAGSGEYVVISDASLDRSYVFFHLLRGSTTVSQGQGVGAGQRIGRVGSTGNSTGPHLHFELWVGGWFSGGHAIDPAPTLRSWER